MRKKKFVSKAISFILTLCISASSVATAAPGQIVYAAHHTGGNFRTIYYPSRIR